MKTFLSSTRPIIVGMLKSKTKNELLDEIARIRKDGADAYGFQIDNLNDEFKSREHLKEIFDAMSDKPVYCTNYMKRDWDTMSEYLLMAVELGATLVDIPADMFDPSDMELSMSKEAIGKQTELVDKIHELGGEVLISSHVFRYVPKETVAFIAGQHKARGADFETGGLVKRVKAVIPVLVPLLISSVRRADELGEAMDARCYAGSKNRTKYKKLTFGWRDLFAVLFISLVLAGVIVLRIYFPKVV